MSRPLPPGVTEMQVKEMARKFKLAAEATDPASERFLNEICLAAERGDVPIAALITWHLGHFVASVVLAEERSVDLVLKAVRDSAEICIKRHQQAEGN